MLRFKLFLFTAATFLAAPLLFFCLSIGPAYAQNPDDEFNPGEKIAGNANFVKCTGSCAKVRTTGTFTLFCQKQAGECAGIPNCACRLFSRPSGGGSWKFHKPKTAKRARGTLFHCFCCRPKAKGDPGKVGPVRPTLQKVPQPRKVPGRTLPRN